MQSKDKNIGSSQFRNRWEQYCKAKGYSPKTGEREVLFEQRNSGQGINKIIDTGHEATNVYGIDVVATTQKALGGGLDAKTGLYAIGSSKIKGFKEKEDVANALTATCYKGYGNDGVTMIASDKEVIPTQIGNSKKFGNASGGESAYTLRASEPNGVVEIARVTPMRWSRNEKGKEARRRARELGGRDYTPFSGGHRELVESKDDISGCITNALNKDSLLKQETRIRRLTPTECERLMGLEDGWTAKGIMDDKEVDISDTQRYKMCGNGVVVNCVDYIYSLLFGNGSSLD